MKYFRIKPFKTSYCLHHIPLVGSAEEDRRHQQKWHFILPLAFLMLLFMMSSTATSQIIAQYRRPTPLGSLGNPLVASDSFIDPFSYRTSIPSPAIAGSFRAMPSSSQRLINQNPSGLVVISDCRYPGLPATRSISGNRLIRPPTGLQSSRTPWHLASRCCLAYQSPAGTLQVLGQVPCSLHIPTFTSTGN